jgi:5-methylcytosine-specific restriction protein A
MRKLTRLAPSRPLLTLKGKAPAAMQVERIRGRTLQTRNARLMRSNPLCVHCAAEGRTTAAEVWDHRIPLWMGGEDGEGNLQGLCIPHHALKSAAEAKLRHGGAP